MNDSPSNPIRVLVSDTIAAAGVDLLRETPGIEVTFQTGMSPEELLETIADHDALIVRSATKVTSAVMERAGRLRAIGRAGTGVDNIDLETATRKGVVVMNTPGGNSTAAAEHTISLLLALARNVPQADADLRDGRWERKRYMGVEVAGKRLGVIGLGRIGRQVAGIGRGLKMEVQGFDPYVSEEVVRQMGIEPCSFDDLLATSDFVTLHVPRTKETQHLIGADQLSAMKHGARLINVARGGLVDEQALYEAVEREHLAGAALDVFENEPPRDSPLVGHPRVVTTPHLGASTVEAQERVGVEIAEKVRDFLQSGAIRDAVNFPSIDRDEYATLAPLMDLGERLGSFLAQVVDGGVRRLELRCHGAFVDLSLRPLVMAATKGLLRPALHGGVSFVNALALAQERGIRVEDGRSNESTPYAGLLRLTAETDAGTTTLAGTLDAANRPKLVELDGVPIDCTPDGHLLCLRNQDVPGVVGQIGSLMGRAAVNIAGIQLGRFRPGEEALSIISVDSAVPTEVLDGIRAIPEIVSLRAVEI